MTALIILIYVILALGGLFLIVLGLPGTLLILAAAGYYAFFRDFPAGDLRVMLILAGLALFAEILEYAVTYFGARKSQVPKDVVGASIIGGVVGAIVGVPIALIGSILGMFVGLAVAAFGYSFYKDRHIGRAWQHTKSCLISRTLAIVAKALMGLIMIGYTIWSF